jgi:hypothetical protein
MPGRADVFCTYWMSGRADAFSTEYNAQSRSQKDTIHFEYAFHRTGMSAEGTHKMHRVFLTLGLSHHILFRRYLR